MNGRHELLVKVLKTVRDENRFLDLGGFEGKKLRYDFSPRQYIQLCKISLVRSFKHRVLVKWRVKEDFARVDEIGNAWSSEILFPPKYEN